MLRKPIGFFEGIIYLLLLQFLMLVLKFLTEPFYSNVFFNPFFVSIPYLIISYFIIKLKSGVEIRKNVDHNLNIKPIFYIAFSLFLIVTFLLELEAFLKLNLEEYFQTFNIERGLPFFFITTIFFIPVVEEIFFRIIILGGLAKRYNFQISLILSSLIFSIAHLEPYSINVIVKLISSFLLGYLLGYTYLKTNNFTLIVLIHMLWNALWVLKGNFIVLTDLYLNNINEFVIFCITLIIFSVLFGYFGFKKLKCVVPTI